MYKISEMPVKNNAKLIKQESKIQDYFMNRLKAMIPPGLGLAEELADLLQVSTDSAYRRIRGETDLTLEEIFTISKKYKISIDDVFGNQTNSVTFAYTKLTDSAENFEEYLKRLIGHLTKINKFPNRKIFYVAEDTPLFYSFFSQKFASFKLFYWQRSVLNVAEYQNKKFTWDAVPQKLVELAHHSFKEYMCVPSSEVWTSETILTGLKQIKYYLDSGILDKTQALELITESRNMISLVQFNASNARKNLSDEKETFQLFHSDVLLGTNCIYIIMGDEKYSYITFNTMNSLTTANSEFCEETEHWMKNLERKSTLISGVGEKQRYAFFNRVNQHINEFEEAIRLS